MLTHAEFGEVAVCIQFAVLPCMRVPLIWLRLVADVLSHISLPGAAGILHVMSTSII